MRNCVAAFAWACSSLVAGAGQVPTLRDVNRLAGTYYQGDGLGVNWNLIISPTGRFSFTWDGCLGRYDENEDEARMEDGFLKLRPEKPLDQGMRKQFPLRWLPVSWGERLYLLEEEDIPLFAKYANQGWEPRSEAHGLFLLRREDWTKKVSGAPELPPKWSYLLLPTPVTAHVLRVFDDRRAEIDRGSAHGLQVGMLLTAVDGDDWVDVTVRSVGSHRSVIEPEDGHALTTRHRVLSRP